MTKPGRPTLSAEKADRVRVAMRDLMRELDLDGAGLARKLDVSGSAVSQVLSGKNAPSYQTVEAVASLRRVSVAQLLGEVAPTGEGDTPETAAVAWARSAKYPEVVIERFMRKRKGPPLSYEGAMNRMRSYKSDWDAGITEEPSEAADLPEPRRGRAKR